MTKKFDVTWESLQTVQTPEWFSDAKFGIWAHWGPQAVPMVGDWYARNMYIQGHPQYEHHVRTYGHPSKFGYKDIVRQWKAEKFDPVRLVNLYKQCGARYFVALAVHCDNFDCWNSTHHRWNSVEIGPGKDIVGLWAKATRAAGLRFGVTEHHAWSYSWFNTNKSTDSSGPWAGIPYDGQDSTYADFYHEKHDDMRAQFAANASDYFKSQWLARITDLIDQHDPDLLYTDGSVPFGDIGLEMVAHLYNRSIEKRGQLESVYTLKDAGMYRNTSGYFGEYREGIGVLDLERGVVDDIQANPWQTDTCVGGWYYNSQQVYKTPQEIVHMLADVVSKNGNLLLNVPPRPDGTIDEQEEWTIRQVGRWLDVNGEAIYGTRPWTQYGEGPTQLAAGMFAEKEKRSFTAQDFRFTVNGNMLYAINLDWVEHGEILIKSLAGIKVEHIALLGSDESLQWAVSEHGLHIQVPENRPCDYAYSYKVKIGR
jgi:alpha-L-fucosidase